MLKKKIESIEPKQLTNLYLIKEFMKRNHIKEIAFEDNWFGDEKLSIVEKKEEKCK